MSQALYRKWRPRSFDDIVGQDHVTQTLHNALKNSRIVHAYLFSGPRGTGKTSTARILAKAVNCLTEEEKDKPCNQCQMCQAIDEGRAIDLIEIDAASHTGVDDIRDLKEKISLSPGEARYKFYIIDEVHMLSGSAFNALLKTLEEPPAHAILVLATTDPHKIPATVLSRCQRFDFRPIGLEDMIGRLRRIAIQEGLEVQEAALELVARQSTGSMRDAESLLDQLSSYGVGEITLEQVQAMLGTVSSRMVKELASDLATFDVAAGLDRIGRAVADGADPRQLNEEVLEYLRGLLLVKTTNRGPSNLTEEQRAEMVQLAKKFTLDRLVTTIKLFSEATLGPATQPHSQLPLELALVQAMLSGDGGKASAPERSTSDQPDAAPARAAPPDDDQLEPARVKESSTSLQSEGQDVTLEGLQDEWARLLSEVRKNSKQVEALLRDCRLAQVRRDIVILSARYALHKEKLDNQKSKQLVAQAITRLTGQPCRVRFTLASDNQSRESTGKEKRQAIAEDPVVKAALEMGGEIGKIR